MRSLRSLCYNKFSPAGLGPGLLDCHILSLNSQLLVPRPSPSCWGRSFPEHEGNNVHLLLLSVFSPSLTSLGAVSKRFHQLFPFLSTTSALLSYFFFFCLTSFLYKAVFSTNISLVCTSWGPSEPAGSAHTGLSPSAPRAANFCMSAQSSQWFLTL